MKTLLSRLAGLAALLLLLLCLPGPARAEPYFYRVLKVPPDNIFANGFPPWGSNHNLLQHVQGSSCNRARPGPNASERTTYTSMSGTLEAARRVARAKLEAQRRLGAVHPRVWMYQVRPTPEHYNVALTFERAGQPLHTGPLRYPYQNALLLDEWVAPGAVPAALVREARQYQLVDGQAIEVTGTAITNTRYQEGATTGNTHPLPAETITGAAATGAVAGRTRAVFGDIAEVMSACWCAPPQDELRKRAGDATPEVCDGVRYHNEVVPQARYMPVVNDWGIPL